MKKNNNQGINTQIHLDMVRELREKSYTFLDFFFNMKYMRASLKVLEIETKEEAISERSLNDFAT